MVEQSRRIAPQGSRTFRGTDVSAMHAEMQGILTASRDNDPHASTIDSYRKIADALPLRVPAATYQAVSESINNPDPVISKAGKEVFTWLNIKTVISVAERYSGEGLGDVEDFAQEGVTILYENVDTIHQRADSSMYTYRLAEEALTNSIAREHGFSVTMSENRVALPIGQTVTELFDNAPLGVDEVGLERQAVVLAQKFGITEDAAFKYLSRRSALQPIHESKMQPEREDTEVIEDIMVLDELLRMLPERNEQMLRMRFGNGFTLDEIAQRYNLVPERARQIIAKTIKSLQHEQVIDFVTGGVKPASRSQRIMTSDGEEGQDIEDVIREKRLAGYGESGSGSWAESRKELANIAHAFLAEPQIGYPEIANRLGITVDKVIYSVQTLRSKYLLPDANAGKHAKITPDDGNRTLQERLHSRYERQESEIVVPPIQGERETSTIPAIEDTSSKSKPPSERTLRALILQKQAWKLQQEDGKTYDEISEILNVSLGSIRRYLQNERRDLGLANQTNVGRPKDPEVQARRAVLAERIKAGEPLRVHGFAKEFGTTVGTINFDIREILSGYHTSSSETTIFSQEEHASQQPKLEEPEVTIADVAVDWDGTDDPEAGPQRTL